MVTPMCTVFVGHTPICGVVLQKTTMNRNYGIAGAIVSVPYKTSVT